jgi:Periplasmic binding protein-like domain
MSPPSASTTLLTWAMLPDRKRRPSTRTSPETGATSPTTTSAIGAPLSEELGLAGFDDLPLASLLARPLRVVVQPAYDIGRTAASLLLARTRGDEAPPRRVVLPVELSVRTTSLRNAAATSSASRDAMLPELEECQQ